MEDIISPDVILFRRIYYGSFMRRQILTTKVDPRTVRVNIFLMAVDP